MNRIFNISCLATAFFLLFPLRGLSVTNEELGAILAKSDMDVKFSKDASKYVVLLKNITNGNFNSGLLIFHPDYGVAIANYHLLASTSDTVVAYLEGPSNEMVEFPVRYSAGDPANDIAAFVLNHSENEQQRKTLINKGFKFHDDGGLIIPSSNFFMDVGQFADESQLRRGQEIFFLGFPLQQGIVKQVHKVPLTNSVSILQEEWIAKSPIVRFGRIASSHRYNEFLIDAMVSHGNSGSPVFVVVREPRVDGVSVELRFAGLVKGFLSDNISYKSDLGQTISLPHNSGLGVVATAASVLNVIRQVR